MGYYIQGSDNKGKAGYIRLNYRGEDIPQPESFNDIPTDKALIVVVNNGMFDAAGFAYDEREFQAFIRPDGRAKEFLLIDRKLAVQLTGYKELA